MRCLLCKVDLEDNHINCPLCEKKTVASTQQISILTAPYPVQKPVLPKK